MLTLGRCCFKCSTHAHQGQQLALLRKRNYTILWYAPSPRPHKGQHSRLYTPKTGEMWEQACLTCALLLPYSIPVRSMHVNIQDHTARHTWPLVEVL